MGMPCYINKEIAVGCKKTLDNNLADGYRQILGIWLLEMSRIVGRSGISGQAHGDPEKRV